MSSACKPAGEGEEGMDAVMHAVVVEHKHVVFTSVIKIILRTDACPPPHRFEYVPPYSSLVNEEEGEALRFFIAKMSWRGIIFACSFSFFF